MKVLFWKIIYAVICGVVCGVVCGVLFEGSGTWLVVAAVLGGYYIYDTLVLENKADALIDIQEAFLQALTRREVEAALGVIAMKYARAAEKYEHLAKNKKPTWSERSQRWVAKDEMESAKKKYRHCRLAAAEFRKDLPWKENEQYNAFLPADWRSRNIERQM